MPDDATLNVDQSTKQGLEPVVTDAVVPGTQPPVESPAPEPDKPSDPMFTKAEVDARVKSAVEDRLARDRRSRRNEAQVTKEPAAKEAPKVKTKTEAPVATEPSRSAYRAFDRAMGKHQHLTEVQYELVEEKVLHASIDKDDVGPEVDEFVAKMFPGAAKSEPQPAQRDTQGENGKGQEDSVKKPPDPAAIDNHAPAAAVTWSQITDPSLLTGPMISQIINEKGLRNGQRYIRNLAERWGKSVRIVTE